MVAGKRRMKLKKMGKEGMIKFGEIDILATKVNVKVPREPPMWTNDSVIFLKKCQIGFYDIIGIILNQTIFF